MELTKKPDFATIFPFEEDVEYLDRGIFPFKAAKVILPLDFNTFDNLCIIPFEPTPGGKGEHYMTISIGRNRYRKQTKIEMSLTYGGSRVDHEKWKRLYSLVDLFWKKGDVHENIDGQQLREDILAFCQQNNISAYEYTSTDTFRSVEP